MKSNSEKPIICIKLKKRIPDFNLRSHIWYKETCVAVKTLMKIVTESTRSDSHKELRIFSRLRDSNSLCTRYELLGTIAEYMGNGDLTQFLQEHVAETVASVSPNTDTLNCGRLTYMATQIARGIKYLGGSISWIEIWNCLVDRPYTIKITDIGMSRNLYNVDYYKIEGCALLTMR